MGLKAKWEYFRAIYERYRQADRKTKQAILSEFCLNTHYHRKYAIRLLNGPAPGKRSRDAGHARRRGCSYGPQTLSILEAVWEAAGYPWSVRLKALLPLWMPWIRKRFGVRPEIERQLLRISARQIDRRLRAKKTQHKRRMYGRTKPGLLLKHHIPVKTDSGDVDRPGFTEIDLVSDSDNGSEFINWHLKAWCERQGIQLTRGRPYKKDDNAHVEQKNWTHVRKLLGWDRYDSTEAVEAINDLYRNELRLWLNLYLPSVQLVKKIRVGSKLRRVYDAPQTPLERVARSAQADATQVAELQQLRQNLNPFQLAKTIDRKLERIYRLANRRRSPKPSQELPAPKRKPRGREKGCGKAAAWKSPTTDFSTPLGNPAKGAGFPLSHSPGGDGPPVTFQMSRRATPGLHS